MSSMNHGQVKLQIIIHLSYYATQSQSQFNVTGKLHFAEKLEDWTVIRSTNRATSVFTFQKSWVNHGSWNSLIGHGNFKITAFSKLLYAISGIAFVFF